MSKVPTVSKPMACFHGKNPDIRELFELFCKWIINPEVGSNSSGSLLYLVLGCQCKIPPYSLSEKQ